MNQNIGSISYKQAKGTPKLFEHDPESDFFVLFEEKLYPLRKQFLIECPYFQQFIRKNHRVNVITQKFNVLTFYKVIGCLYGLQCRFDRNNEVLELMRTIKFLQFTRLEQSLKNEILQNFKEYDLFTILQIGYKYSDGEIEQKCFQELVKMNFEQMNFNRMQLLRCDQQLFIKVIKLHQKWKSYGKIKGLSFQDLRKIVQEYNLLNNNEMDILDILALLSSPNTSTIFQVQDEQKQQSQIESLTKIRKCSTFDDFEKMDYKRIIKIKNYTNKAYNICQDEEESFQSNCINYEINQKSGNEISQSLQLSIKQNRSISLKRQLKYQASCYEDDDYLERTTSPQSEEMYHSEVVNLFQKNELDKSLNFLSIIQKIKSQQGNADFGKFSNRKKSIMSREDIINLFQKSQSDKSLNFLSLIQQINNEDTNVKKNSIKNRKKSMMQREQGIGYNYFNQKLNFQSRLIKSQKVYVSNMNEIPRLDRDLQENI